MEVIADYEKYDSIIILNLLNFFRSHLLIFGHYIDDFPEEKIFIKLSSIIEASLYQFRKRICASKEDFLIDLIEDLLFRYHKLATRFLNAKRDLFLYYESTLKTAINTIIYKIKIFYYEDINLYRNSEFKSGLYLCVKILYLLNQTREYLLHRECGGSRIPQPSGWG